MTTVCRIPIEDGKDIPRLDFITQDGYIHVRVPNDTQILDSDELCKYPRCRKRTAVGTHCQKLQYCEDHSSYSRTMQRRNYANGQRKIESGLCVRHGCQNQRAPHKRKPGQLGRCCIYHAAMSNDKAKKNYISRVQGNT